MNIILKYAAFIAVLVVAPLSAQAKDETLWSDNQDYVRLQASEGGATNAHPASVETDRLARLLATIQLKDDKGKYVPLLRNEECDRMAANLHRALEKAGPKQDIVFFSTERRGDSIIPTKAGVSGRVFVADNKLNLIIGTPRLEYQAIFNIQKKMPAYSEGSRTAANIAILQAENAIEGATGRTDWLAWDLSGAAPVRAATQPTSDNQAKPAASTAPDSASPQEQRLKRLQRLHDQGLITDQEYQNKRQEILKEL